MGVDVYPTRELPISTAVETVVHGTPAEGYEVTSISVQPESVTVAADAQLLESLTELLIQPVNIDGANQTFSQRTRIVTLNDFKDISTEQVYVTVNIEEVQKSAWADVELTFVNHPDELTCTFTDADFRVLVTGPTSRVDELVDSGVEATVDLSGLGAGEYTLPIIVDTDLYHGMALEFEPASVNVRLDATSGME